MSLLKLDQSGCEIESVPPLVKWAKSAHLPPLTPTSTFQRFDGGKTVQAHTDAAMREYGELCRKQALEEAVKACEDIDDRCHDCLGQNEHEFCTVPVKENYIEAIQELIK